MNHRLSDVFHAVGPEVQYAVIPIENSTYGQVIDTLDCLRLSAAGSRVFVRVELITPIQHCLVVRRGVEQKNIKKILSHEQVLFGYGEHLPHPNKY